MVRRNFLKKYEWAALGLPTIDDYLLKYRAVMPAGVYPPIHPIAKRDQFDLAHGPQPSS